ncbi:hypothetical protein H9L39_14334 [Fusarium oxysporum f. sp. albedinis]|nr:hypothetical protein H9L39_14334 [Fusarium oxysporum f. sp. albedinis]
MDQANDEWPARKRLRTSHACDACRTRKTRCDGNNPCATCASIGHDCTYGSEANSRSKNDLILESVLRVEKTLHELRSAIPAGVQLANSPQTNRTNSFSGSSPDLNLRRQSHAIQTPTSQDQRENVNNFENAVLDSMHTSTTESILQWPHFDVFPLLRHDGDSIFYLEQARPPLAVASNPMYPYVDAEDITSMLEAFERNINFWYPSMSQEQLGNLRATLQTGMPSEDTVHSCLCLLTLALGCASQAAEDLRFTAEPDAAEKDRRLRKRKLGDIYFQLALKKLHVAHLQVDSESTQCLFFTALYFASLVRPLQAWEYLSATATRCMLLLSYPPNTHDDEAEERIRRIFWSCYILESDYMAELSACPPSGIARVESSIPLPSTYHTHPSEIVEEESSLYFLACISMRRLLNRVHQLLYAKDTGAAFDHTRFPRIVAELQRQLDDWREVLPASFSFSIDTEEAATAAGGFLRQRYLTCKGVIYRPYLMWMLSSSYAETRVPPIPDAMQNCKLCLDACLLHALDLRGFPQTVLIDTWICSLSMSGAMLIILAASHVPALKEFIGSRATLVGSHLEKLFRNWREVSFGGDSPSVDRINGLVKESPITTRIHEKIQAAKAKASRDFRSDVVTVPVEEMMEAILAASVNDDIYDAEGNPSAFAPTSRNLPTVFSIADYVRSFPVSEGSRPVAMHLDAARVIDSVVAEGVSLKDYAACFDSMSICLAKGIGASMGSVIVGSKRFIERCKYYRKMLGGGTRQPGMMAAAALSAFEYTVPQFPAIHALAKRAGSQLEDTGYRLALPAQSNMVVLDLAGMDIPGAAFVQYCADAAVAVFPNGRLVFHHQTSEEAVADLVNALKRLLQAKKDGKALNNEAVQGGCL